MPLNINVADSKSNLLSMACEARLMEIADVLNHDLIPSLFERNGWDETDYPKFVYGDLDETDLEAFSKAIQRIAAVGMIAKTADNVNRIADVLDLPHRFDPEATFEEVKKLTGAEDGNQTKSGKSFSTDTGGIYGTSNSVAGTDTASLNSENTG